MLRPSMVHGTLGSTREVEVKQRHLPLKSLCNSGVYWRRQNYVIQQPRLMPTKDLTLCHRQ